MPRGSMLKFFRDRGGPDSGHGGYLQWPGTADGFPVRTGSPLPPDLRQGEFDELPLAYDFKSGEFKLWLPEEKLKFDAVMDCITNGWYLKYNRRDRDTPDGIVVWLEWIQIYGETPTGKTPPGGPKQHAQQIQQLVLNPGDPPSRYAPPPTRPLPVSSVSNSPLGWPDQNGAGR